MQFKTWVLLNKKIGGNSQAIGLAESLSSSYFIQKLEYKKYSQILQYFSFSCFYSLQNKTKESIYKEFEKNKPDIIISAGNAASSVALALKSKSKNHSKIIQIMRSNHSLDLFDFVVLPSHDKISDYNNRNNIIRSIGSLSRKIDDTYYTAEEVKILDEYVTKNTNNIIAFLIGGVVKSYRFSNQFILNIVNSILKLASQRSDHLLFILFSRRTEQKVKYFLQNSLAGKFNNIIFYDCENEKINPYNWLLIRSRYLIVTADSISMCSEVASLGKPLYIMQDDFFASIKHLYFLQQLIDLNIAKKFNFDKVDELKYYYYVPLNEMKRVGNIIKKRLNSFSMLN